jgi:outer membrane protein TolC
MDDHYNSVFYTRFVTDSLRLENERALIAFEYKPKINAYTDAGLNSSLQYNPYKNWGWSAGLILSIPIYDNHQRKMKYGRIEIEERTRKVNRDFALKQYYVQVAMLKNQLVATEWLVSKISNQIEYAHTLIIANGKLLQTGDISMKDYITAVSNYLNSKQLLTKNTIERLRILNEINYWNVRP